MEECTKSTAADESDVHQSKHQTLSSLVLTVSTVRLNTKFSAF
jgi:hypothetical protein